MGPIAKQSPKSRWRHILAVAFLAWNLLGAFACFQQIELSGGRATVPQSSEETIYAKLPLTYDGLFIGAEVAGLAGATLFLLGRRSARSWFGASLISVLFQFGYLFATSNLLAREGFSTLRFPLLVVAIGVIQLWSALATRESAQ